MLVQVQGIGRACYACLQGISCCSPCGLCAWLADRTSGVSKLLCSLREDPGLTQPKV